MTDVELNTETDSYICDGTGIWASASSLAHSSRNTGDFLSDESDGSVSSIWFLAPVPETGPGHKAERRTFILSQGPFHHT